MIEIFNIRRNEDANAVKFATFSMKVKRADDTYVINFMNYFVKGANRWIGYPAKQDPDNPGKYIDIYQNDSLSTANQIRDEAVAILAKHFQDEQPDELPF